MAVIFDWLKLCCKDIKNLSELQRKGNKYSLYIKITRILQTICLVCPNHVKCVLLVKKCNFKRVIYTTGDNEILKIVKPSQIQNPILIMLIINI